MLHQQLTELKTSFRFFIVWILGCPILVQIRVEQSRTFVFGEMGLYLSRNIANFILSLDKKVCGKAIPVEIGNMVSLVSRTGRHLQRYDRGCRQVVG